MRTGELLFKLDDRDLKLERLRWVSQREQYLRQHRDALANHERAQIRILRAQLDQAEAQLALVDEQLYVLTKQGSLAAFHAPTGMALWARNLNEGRYPLLPPTHLWTPYWG